MQNSVVIKGKLIGPRNVELDQPVSGAKAEVEVVVHPLSAPPAANGETISQFLRRLPAGNRTKQDIDEQVREERGSWGDR